MKTTKKDMFNAILAVPEVAANPEMVEFLNHEIELNANRNAKRSSKPSKAQIEKDAQRERIVEFLGDHPSATCAEVADAIGVTLHSATGLLTTLRKAHIVRRDYSGKTPVYSLGSEAEGEEAAE